MANDISSDPVAVQMQAALNPKNPPLPATKEIIRIIYDRLEMLACEREALTEAVGILETRMSAAETAING